MVSKQQKTSPISINQKIDYKGFVNVICDRTRENSS
jgi:hypothetical protein